MSTNKEVIDKIKEFFDEEVIAKADVVNKFSDDVVSVAYQKMIDGIKDMLDTEDDPMVISEVLQNFLSVSKMIDERGLARQQLLLKLFEQINKYDQSRYY